MHSCNHAQHMITQVHAVTVGAVYHPTAYLCDRRCRPSPLLLLLPAHLHKSLMVNVFLYFCFLPMHLLSHLDEIAAQTRLCVLRHSRRPEMSPYAGYSTMLEPYTPEGHAQIVEGVPAHQRWLQARKLKTALPSLIYCSRRVMPNYAFASPTDAESSCHCHPYPTKSPWQSISSSTLYFGSAESSLRQYWAFEVHPQVVKKRKPQPKQPE